MKLRSDPQEIARALEVLFQAGDVVEMRVPKTEHEGTVSGYFSDFTLLAKALASRNGDAGVYVTLNPVVPSLLARSSNRIKSRAKTTTSDKDIAARRRVLIDCDPVRPAEISSTDEEHEAALKRARYIRLVLLEEGWPEPLLGDSGNGGHLVYVTDLPNDEAARKLIEGVLKALAKRFNDAVVTVDENVYNAARIVKAYGTVARKGDDVPERPHRLSRILEVPDALVPVSRELLEKLAGAEPPRPPPAEQRSGKFSIERWITEIGPRTGVEIQGPIAKDGGREWRFIGGCPFQPDYADANAGIVEDASGKLGFHCFCGDHPPKSWHDLRELVQPVLKQAEPERPPAAVDDRQDSRDLPDLIPFHFADTGNADRLVCLYGANLRYCFAYRKWMFWDGRRWVVDETGRALKLAKRTMISFLRQAVDSKNEAAEKFARASLDARRLNAMLALAQSELPITPDELDRNRSLLNFTNGTVDLKTGKLGPHRRDDWITKIVAFPYRPQAACPVWLNFVGEAMGGGPDAGQGDLDRADELISYLQLALGYSITGEVTEKAVFVAHGGGDNGKTTLLSAVRDLIHDFAATIGLDLLMTKDDSNNVAAARAKLQGVRFASSSETEEGQKLSAARLKRICQGPGGEIEACRKYENPITFPETHKLWIDANHRPELPATDAAVWNRLHLIPFTVTIPKERQDRELTAKLMKEGEGILAWLVAGARQWYAKGLPQSEVVNKATKEWQQELDRLRVYLDEFTEKSDDAQAWLLNKVLFEDYKSWCEKNGERFLSHIRFTRQMESMGYQKNRKDEGNVWLGIRFKKL
jgi:P4 family phage/plasmid primase-like protien